MGDAGAPQATALGTPTPAAYRPSSPTRPFLPPPPSFFSLPPSHVPSLCFLFQTTSCRRQAWVATRSSDLCLPLPDLDPGHSPWSIPAVSGISRDLLVCCHRRVIPQPCHVHGAEELVLPGTLNWRGPSDPDLPHPPAATCPTSACPTRDRVLETFEHASRSTSVSSMELCPARRYHGQEVHDVAALPLRPPPSLRLHSGHRTPRTSSVSPAAAPTAWVRSHDLFCFQSRQLSATVQVM